MSGLHHKYSARRSLPLTHMNFHEWHTAEGGRGGDGQVWQRQCRWWTGSIEMFAVLDVKGAGQDARLEGSLGLQRQMGRTIRQEQEAEKRSSKGRNDSKMGVCGEEVWRRAATLQLWHINNRLRRRRHRDAKLQTINLQMKDVFYRRDVDLTAMMDVRSMLQPRKHCVTFMTTWLPFSRRLKQLPFPLNQQSIKQDSDLYLFNFLLLNSLFLTPDSLELCWSLNVSNHSSANQSPPPVCSPTVTDETIKTQETLPWWVNGLTEPQPEWILMDVMTFNKNVFIYIAPYIYEGFPIGVKKKIVQ